MIVIVKRISWLLCDSSRLMSFQMEIFARVKQVPSCNSQIRDRTGRVLALILAIEWSERGEIAAGRLHQPDERRALKVGVWKECWRRVRPVGNYSLQLNSVCLEMLPTDRPADRMTILSWGPLLWPRDLFLAETTKLFVLLRRKLVSIDSSRNDGLKNLLPTRRRRRRRSLWLIIGRRQSRSALTTRDHDNDDALAWMDGQQIKGEE